MGCGSNRKRNFVTKITSKLRDQLYGLSVSKGAAMRKVLSIGAVATLLFAAAVDVVAAGVKAGVVRNHFYYAAPRQWGGYSGAPWHEELSDRTTPPVRIDP